MPPKDLTSMLDDGPDDRREVLLQSVYEELRELAARKLKRERADHVLQPTALVHEAYLKLVDQKRVSWKGRTHFLAVAAQAMQRILIDQARARDRQKRGGGWRKVTLSDALTEAEHVDLVVLDDALRRMRELDERQAQVVNLRLFGELTTEQTADILDVSVRTVERDWMMGRAWLRRELARGETS